MSHSYLLKYGSYSVILAPIGWVVSFLAAILFAWAGDPLQQPVLVTLAGFIAIALFVGFFALTQLMVKITVDFKIWYAFVFVLGLITVMLLNVTFIDWIPPILLLIFVMTILTAINWIPLLLGTATFSLLWLSEYLLYYPVLFFLGIEIRGELLQLLLILQFGLMLVRDTYRSMKSQ